MRDSERLERMSCRATRPGVLVLIKRCHGGPHPPRLILTREGLLCAKALVIMSGPAL